jgi:hypothetical protein
VDVAVGNTGAVAEGWSGARIEAAVGWV